MGRPLDTARLGDHIDRLYRAACALTGNRVAADDLVQETYARVLAKPRMIKGEDDVGYLVRTMRNVFLDQRRQMTRRATDSVDPEHVREVYLALRKRSDGVLVEGPSGLLAPLGDGRTTADLAKALGLPLVIICRPDRGTVNHVALTLEAAFSRNLSVRGLIVNGASEHPGLEELANRAELARLAPILEIVPDETMRSLST